ncbi:SAM-dependent chlorinase/fluorinase [Crocinitomicaceae bacterium]|nr:SAM-dependent chlorinase/fluorinase [Crocinitomicaceae bacterium]
MQILTLTSDMGLDDHYVASLKGKILSAVNSVHIIDVTHAVKPFDVSEASFHIMCCYKDFPKGTIHIIGVDSEPIVNFGGSDGSFPTIMEFEGQYFICNDNGFYGAFLQEKRPEAMWRIESFMKDPTSFKFPTKNILAQAAIDLMQGKKPSELGVAANGYKSALALMAVSETNLIKGHVIHVDSYGNAITNVHQTLFERFGNGVPFILYFKRKDYFIDHISNTYNEVAQGEKVATFNENGFLEIAINRGANASSGGAEQLFGLHKNDVVRIEFTPKGSRETLESLF